jgi:hypothetical protein
MKATYTSSLVRAAFIGGLGIRGAYAQTASAAKVTSTETRAIATVKLVKPLTVGQ